MKNKNEVDEGKKEVMIPDKLYQEIGKLIKKPKYSKEYGSSVDEWIQNSISSELEVQSNVDEEPHEGIVEFVVCCTDPNDSIHRDNAQLNQKQIDKFDLKEKDMVQYKIDKDNNAEIIKKKKKQKDVITRLLEELKTIESEHKGDAELLEAINRIYKLIHS